MRQNGPTHKRQYDPFHHTATFDINVDIGNSNSKQLKKVLNLFIMSN
jgi:hypothetical protein